MMTLLGVTRTKRICSYFSLGQVETSVRWRTGGGQRAANTGAGLVSESGRVLFQPGNVLVHPALQEFAAVGANIPGRVKQSILGLDEGFRLAQRRDVQIRQHIA